MIAGDSRGCHRDGCGSESREESARRRRAVKEFRCGDLVPGCPTTFQSESEEGILQQVAAHARDEHGMDEVPPEVVDKVRAEISEA
jgi:predicted small metal-binding protein